MSEHFTDIERESGRLWKETMCRGRTMSEHFTDIERAAIIARLRAIRDFIDPTEAEYCDVRLRLRYDDGYFEVLWGDVSLDHRGVCGASSVTFVMDEDELENVADDLIEQVEDALAGI